jgi:adenosylcobinamide-GDP ribazoletransferase
MNDMPSPRHPALASLHLAASFLTRVPLPPPPYVEGGLARAMAAFPLVGAAIGACAGLVWLGADRLLPPLPAAGLAMLAGMVLTGALHEDGLADFADGLGARGGRERRLEVMRDSRTGAYGALALGFSVLLRVAALAAAPSGLAGLGALVAAGALSRASMPAAMQVMGPARADGLGAAAGMPDASIAAAAVVVGLMAAIAGLGFTGALAAALAGTLAAALVVVLARRALGGFTGDVLGAVAQAVEIAVLLAAAGGWR